MDKASEDYSHRLWDVLIVGAGVAGAVTAHGAARMGKSVLLIDKAVFPRGKACGCCLNHAAVELLERAGLDIRALGAIPVERFLMSSGGISAMLTLPTGLALSREILDTALITHAQHAGAIFMPQTLAEHTEVSPFQRTVRVTKNGIPSLLRAKVVIVADGLAGRMLRENNHQAIAPAARIGVAGTLDNATGQYAPGTIYMACSRHGYVGVVQVEAERLHIAAALDLDVIRDASGCGHAIAKIIRESGMPLPNGIEGCRWYGAPALTRRRKCIAAERLFVIGDAAGYVEPFSGEGMAWALAGGYSVLPLMAQAVDYWNPGLIEQWRRRYADLLESRQQVCRTVMRLLRHPRLTQLTLRALRVSPVLGTPLVSWINHPFLNL